MERSAIFENDLNMEATELRLALPGRDEPSSTTTTKSNKRSSSEMEINSPVENKSEQDNTPPPSKAQVVGWPPVRSYRKNALQQKKAESDASSVMFVKVSMDGAPYLRKIDLKGYKSYSELLNALENMFKCGTFGTYSEREGYYGSEFAPTYEDKDGDWMLVGDVPWDMFINSCKRLRITKGSESNGLGCTS
ncbi:hypothetical protein Leryth_018627 [Lithospermum erythrorhizon]|uniref:Auxin-responsive protein n=1 Tax=Lithospermum erythrorhizon TaxID=34254 RepID=A0AAV3R4H6_LITER|nr:hypothetical protein Leryth_018627 [Lithospermum erythrorhizon]